jgi:hypothetical protein
MSRIGTLAAAVVVAAGAVPSAWGQYGPSRSAAAPDKPPRQNNVPFVVVQVDADYQLVRRNEVAQFQKTVNEQYKEDLKAYQEAKKAAAKEKQKFDEPMPKKPKIKVHPGSFKTEEEANAYIEKAMAKDAKEREAKEAKESSGGKDKEKDREKK